MILLAEWLSEPAPIAEIQDRQEAIQEMAEKLAWRQEFQASGMHYENKKSDYANLLAWVEAPVVLIKHRLAYIATALLLSAVTLLVLSLFMSKMTSGYFVSLLVVLAINYLVLRKVNPAADEIVQTSQKNLNTLRGYRTLIRKIEREHFKSKKLSQLQAVLSKSHYSAFHEINRLCRLLEFSQQRGTKKMSIGGNYLYPLINSFLLIDIYLILGVEKWKLKNKAFLKAWAEVVSEFEVINSLAGFSYSNPDYSYPLLHEKKHAVYFESLGHPLINSNKRVCNTLRSEGEGNIVLVTGSNTGGKSTFLRTVGVNLVLALAGAPCCAKQGQVSKLKLYSSMRTQDNLRQGVSSFYAELNRIEKMLQLMANSQNVFFLLDEMFKGTNSEDRHKGGFSLISQLRELHTSGIIATHDIELARLSETKRLVTNYSFNSEIKDGAMIFSYALCPGICNDFNASELMKRSGINILPMIP